MIPVSIDFVAGSHGHFLEYVCNRFIASIAVDFVPFNDLGASHLKNPYYIENSVFTAAHYSELKRPTEDHIIKITFDYDDLLLLSSGCFFRAGDSNININDLEHDTYNKLKDGWFEDLISNINRAYQAQGIVISRETLNCPRYILREYFKFGFRNPETNGFMEKLSALKYHPDKKIFEFKFSWFYDQEKFLDHISRLSDWYGTKINDLQGLIDLHDIFLSKQIFRSHKTDCDTILDKVVQKNPQPISDLTVLQESYINAVLEKTYKKEMPFMQEKYFNSTQEIVQYINV